MESYSSEQLDILAALSYNLINQTAVASNWRNVKD
jgi:hypothetical protein